MAQHLRTNFRRFPLVYAQIRYRKSMSSLRKKFIVVVDSEKNEPAKFDKKNRKIAEGVSCSLHFLHAWKEH